MHNPVYTGQPGYATHTTGYTGHIDVVPVHNTGYPPQHNVYTGHTPAYTGYNTAYTGHTPAYTGHNVNATIGHGQVYNTGHGGNYHHWKNVW